MNAARITATRVGIHTAPLTGRHPTKACDRCGIQRRINHTRPSTGLCRDCYDVTKDDQ